MKHKVLLKATKTPDEVCIYYADHASHNAINLRYTSDKDVYLENINVTDYGVRNGWEFSLNPELINAVVMGIGINWELILPNVTVIEDDDTFTFCVHYSPSNKKTIKEIEDAINSVHSVQFTIASVGDVVTITIPNNSDPLIYVTDALIILETQMSEIDNPIINITEPHYHFGKAEGASLKMWTTREIATSQVKIGWRFSELESPSYKNNDLL